MADLTRIVRNGKLVKVGLLDVQTIAVDDVTPDISVGDVFETSANTGATELTDLDNPRVDSRITIRGGSSSNPTTIVDSGNFHLNTAAGTMTLNLRNQIVLDVRADNEYVEVTRSVNA